MVQSHCECLHTFLVKNFDFRVEGLWGGASVSQCTCLVKINVVICFSKDNRNEKQNQYRIVFEYLYKWIFFVKLHCILR